VIATPIIPGHAYRVRGAGLDLSMLAASACDALIAATFILEARQ
jgi:hypothetical protein